MVKIMVYLRSGRVRSYDTIWTLDQAREYLNAVRMDAAAIILGPDIKINADHVEEIALEEVQDEATN